MLKETAGLADVRVTAPLYSPAAGTVPVRLTFSVAEAPAARVRLFRSVVTVTLAVVDLDKAPGVAATARVTELVPLLVTVTAMGLGNAAPGARYPKERLD